MSGKLWSLRDRYGNHIYLTNERWEHITNPLNHPEMLDYAGELKETLRVGKRRQDPLNPKKYRYVKAFDNLVADNTHIIAIVLFRLKADKSGKPEPNNYVVTAYQKETG